MSGLVGNALWATQEFIHTIEINPRSSTWAIPQSVAKVSFITSLFFAHVAHVNGMTEFKRACIALSLVSLAASYAFRKLFLSDQIIAAKDASIKLIAEQNIALGKELTALKTEAQKEKEEPSKKTGKEQLLADSALELAKSNEAASAPQTPIETTEASAPQALIITAESSTPQTPIITAESSQVATPNTIVSVDNDLEVPAAAPNAEKNGTPENEAHVED